MQVSGWTIMKIKLYFIFLGFITGIIHPVYAQDISVNALVDRKVAVVNQQMTLTIEIKGTQNQPQQINLPDLDKDFIVAGRTGTSTNMQIINGAMSVSISFGYALIPKHTGKIIIEPIKLKINGKEYSTNSIEIEVIKPQDVPKTPQKETNNENLSIDENLIVTAIPDKDVVYQNEGCTISYKLLFSGLSINTYGIKKTPATTGFWVEEYPMPQNPMVRREVIRGKQYQTAVIKQVELFPTKSGELEVEPLLVEFDIRAPRTSNRSRDIFDRFFEDDFFGRTVKRTVASSPVKIKVLPLPEENRPPDFTGLVGDFKLSATVDKPEVKTHEAITLTIKIVGQGNVRLINEPEIKLPSDFEKYEPKTEQHIERNNDIISGYKIFEYVLIPRTAGIRKIKPVTFSYFNPAEKRYVTLTTEEITVNIEEGDESIITSTPGNLTKEELKVLGTDVRFIKEDVENWTKAGDIFYRNLFYIIFLIIPLVVASGSYVYRNHLERLNTDEKYKRDRRAFGRSMKRLKKARTLLKDDTKSEFYSEISRAVQGYIADKLNKAEAGLLSDEIKELLPERQIDEKTVDEVLRFLQHCDFSRFAPSGIQTGDMENAYNTAKELIGTMDKKMK